MVKLKMEQFHKMVFDIIKEIDIISKFNDD
jgi:hypothetical protein